MYKRVCVVLKRESRIPEVLPEKITNNYIDSITHLSITPINDNVCRLNADFGIWEESPKSCSKPQLFLPFFSHKEKDDYIYIFDSGHEVIWQWDENKLKYPSRNISGGLLNSARRKFNMCGRLDIMDLNFEGIEFYDTPKDYGFGINKTLSSEVGVAKFSTYIFNKMNAYTI